MTMTNFGITVKVGEGASNDTKQDAQGPWRSAWPFAWWNQNSCMDTDKAAELT